MDVGCELAAAVGVAEEIADDGEDGTEGLDRDVPTGASDLGKWDRISARGFREKERGIGNGRELPLAPCRWER